MSRHHWPCARGGNLHRLIWTLTALVVHDLLVVERGWTSEQYEGWLTAALKRDLF